MNKKNILLDYLLHVNPFIDILLISENWLNSTILDSLICLPGYHTLRCDRTIARGGEIMILYKKNLIISPYSPAISIDWAELIAVDVFCNLDQFAVICHLELLVLLKLLRSCVKLLITAFRVLLLLILSGILIYLILIGQYLLQTVGHLARLS